jgi:ABC-type dipeptide/oligopeptide/nickel transport system permease subunit
MLEVLGQDFVRTARAKGLGEQLVVRRHALRNALLPILTVLGVSMGNLLSGAVIVETIFSWFGIGKYGVAPLRILIRHVLPNILGPLVVVASLDIGAIVLSIAGLNFLGLGAQPPTLEWGAMLNDAQPFLQTEPQLILAPAFAMVVTVLAFNLLGDGLRDWLDPQTRHR